MSKQHRPQEQFLAAYDEFSDSVLQHCTFRISDSERAKDLTQETFMKVWEYMAEGNEVRNMKALVFHVLRNLIIDEYRGRKKKSFSLDALKEDGFDAPVAGDSHILAESDTKIVTEAMHELPDNYREVLLLRYIDELPVKEVAELVGESENAISVRIHRGLKILRKNLGIEEVKTI